MGIQRLSGVSHFAIESRKPPVVLARFFYMAFYVADRSTLRSLAWFAGIGSAVAIFLAAA